MDKAKRVNALLKADQLEKVNYSSGSEAKVYVSEEVLREMFNGVYKRSDTMTSLLQQQMERNMEKQKIETKNGSPRQNGSPRASLVMNEDTVLQGPSGAIRDLESIDINNEEFVYNGTNLLTHVNAKAKKPKLYATALLSLLFSDEETRSGSVEPKDGGVKKPALDQKKMDLLKKCIKVRYSEKILEKNWPEIRTSLNQKCLDKLKAFRNVVKEEKVVEED